MNLTSKVNEGTLSDVAISVKDEVFMHIHEQVDGGARMPVSRDLIVPIRSVVGDPRFSPHLLIFSLHNMVHHKLRGGPGFKKDA